MDFESLLSGYKVKACVMSVDILSDDHYGNIRIVAGNKPHCEDIRTAMRIADERMYHDKKEFYDKHPERKYR